MIYYCLLELNVLIVGNTFDQKKGLKYILANHIQKYVHRGKIIQKYVKSTIDNSDKSDCELNKNSSNSHQSYNLMIEWKIKFDKIEDENVIDEYEFNNLIKEFLIFLSKSINLLPGPKNPATKYYEARKKKTLKTIDTVMQNLQILREKVKEKEKKDRININTS